MFKLHTDAVKYINMLIDQRMPLSDDDREFMAASIIQATPRMQLPSVDDIDTEGKLMDMIAGYLKSADPEQGQDILDYLAASTVHHYNNMINELINDKIQDSQFAHVQTQEDEARWAKNR